MYHTSGDVLNPESEGLGRPVFTKTEKAADLAILGNANFMRMHTKN